MTISQQQESTFASTRAACNSVLMVVSSVMRKHCCWFCFCRDKSSAWNDCSWWWMVAKNQTQRLRWGLTKFPWTSWCGEQRSTCIPGTPIHCTEVCEHLREHDTELANQRTPVAERRKIKWTLKEGWKSAKKNWKMGEWNTISQHLLWNFSCNFWEIMPCLLAFEIPRKIDDISSLWKCASAYANRLLLETTWDKTHFVEQMAKYAGFQYPMAGLEKVGTCAVNVKYQMSCKHAKMLHILGLQNGFEINALF